METALTKLCAEYPELKTWPHGDLVDMLGSVSPRMSRENRKFQARYNQLLQGM